MTRIRALSMALQSVSVLTRFDCIVTIGLNATVKFFLVETSLLCAIPFVTSQNLSKRLLIAAFSPKAIGSLNIYNLNIGNLMT